MIQILVMPPGERHLVQAASLLVHPQPRLVARFIPVWIGLKKLMKHDPIRPGAPNRKGVSDHRPLRFAVEAKNLSQIMNQAGQDKPTRMPVLADVLGGLEQMVQLREVRVGIAIIHERVQILQRFPHAHLPPFQRQELLSLALHKLMALVPVIQPVKLPHRRAGVRLIIPELLLGLGGRLEPVRHLSVVKNSHILRFPPNSHLKTI